MITFFLIFMTFVNISLTWEWLTDDEYHYENDISTIGVISGFVLMCILGFYVCMYYALKKQLSC